MTTIPDSSALTGWRKSSYSNGEGAVCVEVVDGIPGVLPVRDSKNPHGPALAFGTGAWTAFVNEVKHGDDS
ncbi:DUF397 domain-containing protein [Streptomyces jumonjinensis]|uniref:DUF397 domain-containing protein n=2 Tax=Streptomyces jumonjinensis TaxID=1945 RepID=A0A646KB80_STRJU|nr:DUF397 domain-containing protein [Streptomyces jumonjinensis]MQS99474.1 DUF397 domain-containing protein [Streptomyces jumonjinensis]